MARILVVGATGHLGRELVAACRRLGHEPHALVRPATRKDAARMAPLEAARATLHEGDLADQDSLLRACRGMDTVISAVGGAQVGEEGPLIEVVRQARVERFVPSDFGLDPAAAGPGSCVIFDAKAAVQERVKASGVPYTFIHCNGFFTYWVFTL